MELKINVIVGVILLTLALLWRAMKFLWLRPKQTERCLRKQGLKGSPYKPFLGDVSELISMSKESLLKPINFSDDPLPRIVPFLLHTIQKYGGNCFAWIGPVPWLIITDAEKIREVIAKHEDFRKPNHVLTRAVMVGLFGQEGESWAKHRRIINPAFHIEKLKNMFHEMYESCSSMTSLWEEVLSRDGSGELDVWPFLENLTGDLISRAAFSSSYEQGRRIFDLQTEYVKLALMSLQAANYIPGWRFLPTKMNKRVKEINKEVEGILTKMIDSRRKEMESGGSTKDDLLGTLLESSMRESESANAKEKGLTTKEVIEECKLFYLAGSDTTSSLLVWTLILLSRHQIWQDRARAEVLQVLGNDTKPDFNRLSRLKVVNMILHEVLRMYTPAYMLIRKVYKDVQLGELLIPAGTEVVLPVCITHQDCDLWGHDAKEFNPERFCEGVAKATKGQSIYFPFSTGPRVCIGQNFALLEAKLALSMILQRFSFSLSPSYVHSPCAIFTIKPQYGANLILHKLQN